MSQEQHNWLGPYLGGEDWVHQLAQQTKLFISLMRDPRVHWLTKAIPVITVIYLVSPIDWLQNAVPVLGQLGDVALVVLGFRLFLEFSPGAVVHEHLVRLMRAQGEQKWNVVDDTPVRPAAPPEIVDGTDRVDH
jgi:uncharacterized membrane protein YkvA (DUF1232 family)